MNKIAVSLDVSNFLRSNMDTYIGAFKGSGGEKIWEFLCDNSHSFVAPINELKDPNSHIRQYMLKTLTDKFAATYGTDKIEQIQTAWLGAVIGKMSRASYKSYIILTSMKK